jgi:glutathione synthase/RimK-type ligase-like ATP-grasp enzyme
MLLVLTNSQDVTAAFLTTSLEKAGIPFLRLDTDQLVPRVSFSYRVGSPALKVDGRWLGPDEVTNIWYRRPEALKSPQFDATPEGKYALAEWTEFTECFFSHVPRAKWMNHPAANAGASRKLEQLTTAKSLGFSVPDSLVTQEPDDLLAFYTKHGQRIIVKPVSTGYVERAEAQQDSLVYTNQVLEEHLKDLSDLKVCPAFFQQCIQKDYDVRITSVDDDLHAVALFASDDSGAQRCDIRRNNMADVRYKGIELPTAVENGISRLMKHYGLRFSAIDMAVTSEGNWCFFEINANGQWAWLDQCAGTNIAGSFVKSFSHQGTR